MKIEVYQTTNGAWTFQVVAVNGVPMAQSGYPYANRRNALAAAKLIASSKIKVVVE